MNEQMDHAALIDRLAAGELDDALRNELFIWLDREPSRWRRCAVALLEARELEEALGAWQADPPRPPARLTRPPVMKTFRPGGLFALAASVMVAFSLGVFARGFFVVPIQATAELMNSADRKAPAARPEKGPADAVVKKPSSGSDQRPMAVAAAPATVRPRDLIPPYIRSQLERRGYHLTSHPARLPVVLPDGRRTTVPVDELQLNYVGQRTY